jgi:hypothetical protein
MHFIMAMVMFQIGVDAGPARVSCDGSTLTLQASPINAPANYLIEWEDGLGPDVFLVVNPTETTTYKVTLTDLDTSDVYEDTTTVLVHPGSSDLNTDGSYDSEDVLMFFASWAGPVSQADLDPTGDGRVDILDWFYFCNFDDDPPNTPPSLVVDPAFTFTGETVIINYFVEDAEQTPMLVIDKLPSNGFANLLSGVLRYFPDSGFTGVDSFEVYASDGYLSTPNETVNVEVLPLETFTDIYNDILFPYCKACHIDAVSGGLSMATYQTTQTGGNSGAGFVPGNPELSPIYLRTVNGDMPLGMPPLDTRDVERIRLWILRGAAP